MDRHKKPRVRGLFLCVTLIVVACLFVGCGPENFQARYLAGWSPDGRKLALVPTSDLEDDTQSGLWIFDMDSGDARELVSLPPGQICFHPQWSASGKEILFGVLDTSSEESEDSVEAHSYSVWITRTDGTGMRKVVDSQVSDDGGSLAMPNAIAWGKDPDTVIYQTAVGKQVTAILLDLNSGRSREFLPARAENYTLEFSPSGKMVAALLMNSEEKEAVVYVADSAGFTWRRLGTLHYDHERFESFSSLISWSPDSSRFAVVDIESSRKGDRAKESHIRLFDVWNNESRALCVAEVNSEILWRPRGDALSFSGSSLLDGVPEEGLFQVGIASGEVNLLIGGDKLSVVSWNSADDRIHFFRSYSEESTSKSGSERIKKLQFYSIASDGHDLQAYGQPLSAEDVGWTLSADGNRAIFYLGRTNVSLVEFGARALASLSN